LRTDRGRRAGADDGNRAGKGAAEEALYQGGPKNGLSCAVCTLFRPPHACVIVAGDISAQGWCRFFDMAD
jgi:hypothetical protein